MGLWELLGLLGVLGVMGLLGISEAQQFKWQGGPGRLVYIQYRNS